MKNIVRESVRDLNRVFRDLSTFFRRLEGRFGKNAGGGSHTRKFVSCVFDGRKKNYQNKIFFFACVL
jgi:hypothetical protein